MVPLSGRDYGILAFRAVVIEEFLNSALRASLLKSQKSSRNLPTSRAWWAQWWAHNVNSRRAFSSGSTDGVAYRRDFAAYSLVNPLRVFVTIKTSRVSLRRWRTVQSRWRLTLERSTSRRWAGRDRWSTFLLVRANNWQRCFVSQLPGTCGLPSSWTIS